MGFFIVFPPTIVPVVVLHGLVTIILIINSEFGQLTVVYA